MQPPISPELIQQLEPYLSANTNISQLVDAAIANYLSWQQFLGSIATGGNSEELSRKFNHLLAETQQAQADLRQLIKEANDRVSQQSIWADREFGVLKAAIKEIRQNLTIKDSSFSDAEIEVLRRFAQSMGAPAPSPFKQIFAPVTEAECTDGFCPVPEVPAPAIEPPETTTTKKRGRPAKAAEPTNGALRDRLAQLNRKQLGKLLTQYGIPHRNSDNVVWRVEQMRDLLAQKMPAGEVVAISTETKRRGRPRKVA